MSGARAAVPAGIAGLLLLSAGALAQSDPQRAFPPWPELEHLVEVEGPAVIRIPAAALVLSGLSGGTIETSVLASTLPINDLHRVTVLTQVEGRTLPEGDAGQALLLDLFVYAVAGDTVVGQASQTLKLDLQRHATTLREGGIKALTTLDLPKGRYSLRVLVQDHASREFGLQVRPLTLPASPVPIAPNSPWILEPSKSWIVALGGGIPEDASLRPVLLEAERYLPHADPVLRTGREAIGCLLVPSEGSITATRPSVRFLHREGLRIAEIPATVLVRKDSPWPGLDAVLVRLTVPDLPLGRYWLRLAFHPADGEAIESLGTPVVVAAGDSPSSAQLPASEEAPPRAAATLRKARKALRSAEISTAFQSALRPLAEGDREQAESRVIALEKELAGGLPAAILRDIEAIEWQSLEALADGQWARMLPVALLYMDLAKKYQALRLYPLADHALRMGTTLATTLADHAVRPMDRTEAAQALAALAGQFQRRRRLTESDRLFAQALKLDETNRPALLGIAVTHEQQGRYQEAVQTLRRLVEIAPTLDQGHLRLAINLARTGKPDEALEKLEKLVDSAQEPWIAALAAQEAAAIEIAKNKLQEAEARLTRALESFPDHSAIRVQLAHVVDRRGRTEESRELIKGLFDRPGSGADSARYRYAQWPVSALDAMRVELDETVRARLADLQSLLSPRASTGGQ